MHGFLCMASPIACIRRPEMPNVTLSDTTFSKLKTIAEPFVDTPETLIERLIDAEIQRGKIALTGNGSSPSAKNDFLQQNPDSHESLAFTRVLSAKVDGREIHRPKWNSIMNHLHLLASKRLGSFDAVKRASSVRLRQGRYEEEGFKYLPEADLSIQGVDSNSAWDHSLQIARELSIPIKVTFEWRNKKGAAHPDRLGILEWNPTNP